MKGPSVWLGLALLTGCQSSYLQERGDRAAARGALLQAASNYLAAAAIEGPEQVPALERRRDEVLAGWLEERLSAATSTSPDAARVILARLAHTEWLGPGAKEQVQAALEVNFERVWPELEAAATKGHHHAAVLRALVFAAGSQSPRVSARLAELRRRGAEAHLARADEDPSTAPLHHAVARTLDPTFAIPPAPSSTRPALEVVGPPDCAWVITALRARYVGGSGPPLRLVLEQCASDEQRTRSFEPYYAEIWVPVTYTATVWSLVADRLEGKVITAERLAAQAVTKQRSVLNRRLEVKVLGRLEGLGAGRAPLPLAISRRHEDRAFWSPEASQRLQPIDRAGLEQALIPELSRFLDLEAQGVSRVRAEEDAARALEQGGPTAAEGAWIASLLAQGPLPAAAARYFRDRYGLSPSELTQLLSAETITLSAPPSSGEVLPEPERDSDEDHWAVFRVIDRDHQDDDRWLIGGGVDLYSKFEGAPMGRTPYAHGLGFRARINGVHASLQGALPWLGGSVEGVRLRLQAWSGEDFEARDEHPLFRWSFGLGYEQWLDKSGARFLGVGAPLAASLQPIGPMVVEAGVFLNFAQLKELVEPDPSDPRHDSPVHFAVTFGQRHVYVRAELIHDLGSERTIRGGLELGVRL